MNLAKVSGFLLSRTRTATIASYAKYATKPMHPIKFDEVEDRWKVIDGVPKNWTLIYKAPMTNVFQYLSSYLTVTTGIFASTGAYYGIFCLDRLNSKEPMLLGDVVIADNFSEALIYVVAFCLLHIAVKILVSKYVIRLYQNGDQYTAIYVGHLHNRIIKHDFNLKQCEKLKPTMFVSWGESRYALGSKHGILLETYFKTPAYFNRLVYKKDVDLDDD